jgi:hypothetical protein
VYDSIEFIASSRQYRSSRCLDRGLAEHIELLDVDAIARPPLSVPARVSFASPRSASWRRRASPAMRERPLSLVQFRSMFR